MAKIEMNQKPGESNIDYYLRLAKAADTRMGRIEKLSKEDGFKAVTQYSYAKAKRDLSAFGWKHFERKPPEDPKLFRERLSAVKEFLSAPTSTKAGIKDVYQSKADTLNERYGTTFNWQDMADFFNSGAFDKFKEHFASKTVMKAIGTIQTAMKKIDAIDSNLNLSSMDKDSALKILRQYRQMDKLGINKEKRAKIREMIRNADEWVDASDSDIEDYFN